MHTPISYLTWISSFDVAARCFLQRWKSVLNCAQVSGFIKTMQCLHEIKHASYEDIYEIRLFLTNTHQNLYKHIWNG